MPRGSGGRAFRRSVRDCPPEPTTQTKRAKILLLSQYFPPETFAGANRVAALANALGRAHDVTVITLQPSYPSPDCYSLSQAEYCDRHSPFEVQRLFRFRPHGASPALRALKEHLVAIALASRGATRPADVVVTSSPSMFLGPAALALARLKRALFVWDVRDVTWEFAQDTMGESALNRVSMSCLRRYMWFVVRRCDVLVPATAGIAQLLLGAGTPERNIVTIDNGVSSELLPLLRKKRERAPRDRPLVAYVGLIGEAQGLRTIIDIARQLPAVDFLLAGDGPERHMLQRRAADLGVRNLRFSGYLSIDGVLEVYRISDVLFAQVRDTPTLSRTAWPSKLLEYMAAERPILYAGNGMAGDLIEAIGCGLRVAPDNVTEIVSAVKWLLGSPGLARSLARQGSRFADAGASREERMEPLVMLLTDRLSSRSRNGSVLGQGDKRNRKAQ